MSIKKMTYLPAWQRRKRPTSEERGSREVGLLGIVHSFFCKMEPIPANRAIILTLHTGFVEPRTNLHQ